MAERHTVARNGGVVVRESHSDVFRIVILAILVRGVSQPEKRPPFAEVETELWKIRARTDLLADNEAQPVEAGLNGKATF
jgi:hypothetical protein